MIDAIDFIERNLKENVTVADVADAVSYSVYHFCRTFNKLTHHTPYDYLMRRRLSESAQELLDSDKKIIDVAFDYQFNSPETYSRAFKRMFGVQPQQWRKRDRVDRRSLMPRLTGKHLEHIAKGDYLKAVLEEKDAFQVAGVMTLVKDDRSVISLLWDTLAQELEGLDATGRRYGIAHYPKGWQERGYLYLAAVEAESLDVSGSALVVRTVLASRYARFVHKGPYADLGLTLDYVYQTWLPKSGQHLAGRFEIERHEQDLDDEESEMAIYIPIE
jgi:AraC family transcriptional regulator